MSPLSRFLLCLAFFNLQGRAEKPVAPPSEKESFAFNQISLQRVENGGHSFIQAQLDDQEAMFLVDSGYSQALAVSKQLSEALGKVSEVDPAVTASGIDGDMKTYQASFGKLILGKRFAIEKPTLRVLDLSKVGKLMIGGKQQPVDGLVGSAFLKSVRAVYDFSKPALIVPQGSPPKGIYLRSRKAAGDPVFELKEGKNGFPFVTVKLKGKDFAFLVDTGCSQNTLEPALAKQLELTPESTTSTASGPNGGKTTVLEKVKVASPWMGRFELPSLEFHLVATPATDTAPAGMNYGGIIGSTQLIQMKAVLDFDSYSLVIPKSLTSPAKAD